MKAKFFKELVRESMKEVVKKVKERTTREYKDMLDDIKEVVIDGKTIPDDMRKKILGVFGVSSLPKIKESLKKAGEMSKPMGAEAKIVVGGKELDVKSIEFGKMSPEKDPEKISTDKLHNLLEDTNTEEVAQAIRSLTDTIVEISKRGLKVDNKDKESKGYDPYDERGLTTVLADIETNLSNVDKSLNLKDEINITQILDGVGVAVSDVSIQVRGIKNELSKLNEIMGNILEKMS